MYTVSSQHLSPDGRSAGLQYGDVNHGDISSSQLIDYLQIFSTVSGPEASAAEVQVKSGGGSCTIRNVAGKLVVRSTRDGHARDLYFSPEDIVDHLDRSTTWTPFEPSIIHSTTRPIQVPSVKKTNPALSAATLVLGLGILFYSVHAALLVDSVASNPATEPLLDPAPEQAVRIQNSVGAFSTGPAAGDRVIVIKADKTVTFFEVGSKNPINLVTDTYTIGRHGTQACLVTTKNGLIDLVGTDGLVYYKDLYLRSP
jgi:hypothetical protein